MGIEKGDRKGRRDPAYLVTALVAFDQAHMTPGRRGKPAAEAKRGLQLLQGAEKAGIVSRNAAGRFLAQDVTRAFPAPTGGRKGRAREAGIVTEQRRDDLRRMAAFLQLNNRADVGRGAFRRFCFDNKLIESQKGFKWLRLYAMNSAIRDLKSRKRQGFGTKVIAEPMTGDEFTTYRCNVHSWRDPRRAK
jgi:hypothetical protein